MKLTREEAIKEHRKMWNWIADKLESDDCGVYYDAVELKGDYLYRRDTGKIYLVANCFLCDYVVSQKEGECEICPLDWGNGTACAETENSMYSIFNNLIHSFSYKEASIVAREIANLPER